MREIFSTLRVVKKCFHTYSSIRLWFGICVFVANNFNRPCFTSFLAYHTDTEYKLPCNGKKTQHVCISTGYRFNFLLLLLAFHLMRQTLKDTVPLIFEFIAKYEGERPKITRIFLAKRNQSLTWRRRIKNKWKYRLNGAASASVYESMAFSPFKLDLISLKMYFVAVVCSHADFHFQHGHRGHLMFILCVLSSPLSWMSCSIRLLSNIHCFATKKIQIFYSYAAFECPHRHVLLLLIIIRLMELLFYTHNRTGVRFRNCLLSRININFHRIFNAHNWINDTLSRFFLF